MAQQNASITMEEQQAIAILGNSLYPGAAPESIAMVLGYCKANGLDPFQKPVHIVPMWDSKTKTNRDVVMPGLNLYRTQAAASGLLAGISEPEFGPMVEFNMGGNKIKAPEYAKVSVQRILPNGTIANFSAIEYFDEAVSVNREGKPTAIWLKRPRGMLGKTAESQALRKAFPEKAGAPTAEEMEGKSVHIEDEVKVQALAVDESDFGDLADVAYEKATQGVAAYTDFWKACDKAQRAHITRKFPNGLMTIARNADARKAAEAVVDDVEEVQPEDVDDGIKKNPDGTYGW